VHLLVFYLNKLQSARYNNNDYLTEFCATITKSLCCYLIIILNIINISIATFVRLPHRTDPKETKPKWDVIEQI